MPDIRDTVGHWIDLLHKKLQADFDKEAKKVKPSEYKSAHQVRRENMRRNDPTLPLSDYYTE